MEEVVTKIRKATGAIESVSVNGVKGKRCKDLTADFEKSIGIVVATAPTAEANEVEPQQVRNRG